MTKTYGTERGEFTRPSRSIELATVSHSLPGSYPLRSPSRTPVARDIANRLDRATCEQIIRFLRVSKKSGAGALRQAEWQTLTEAALALEKILAWQDAPAKAGEG